MKIWMILRELLQGPMRDPLSKGRIVRLTADPDRRHRITKRTKIDAPAFAGGLWVYELDGRAQPVYGIYDFVPTRNEWTI